MPATWRCVLIVTDFCVVQDHPSLLVYVDSLQKKNAEALAFYPRQVFERESEKGRIFLGLLNGEPCGYLYVGAGMRTVKCHQVCIQYDARNRLYGATLVAAMEHYAQTHQASAIELRCGFDLDANHFWSSLGYVCVAHRAGGIRRQRTINVWRKDLMPQLLDTIAIVPAVGLTDASVWRKGKQAGHVTQFARGAALDAYRAIVKERAK